MNEISIKNEGLRERKRRETRQRIAETGLKLFVENGYEGTTLEAIAAAAGISRRTFFYYYKSKEEILMAWQGSSILESLRTAILDQPKNLTPLHAARNGLLQLASCQDTKEAIVVDALLRSTEALRARKQAFFVEMENAVFAALSELWPKAKKKNSLRLVAMVSIGTMRLAREAWRQDEGKRPLTKYVRENFAALEAEL